MESTLRSLLKIESVTGEIFLICTNVARTNFYWTTVNLIVGTSRSDSKYQVGICPGDICPGDICPYPEYLNFEQTLKEGSKKNIDLNLLEADVFT